MKKQTRRDYRKIGLIGLGIFIAIFSFVLLARSNGKTEEDTLAANLNNFQAGYIISDYQMTNYRSMSEADIQSWLTARNSCGNWDYGYYLALSRNANYAWHFENGHFICLSEERFGDNDNEIGFQYGESAAHIIWQAAQDYRINPKVLLVLLQKETGLITDPIPNNGDYRKATGYGCPDTAACSSQYYGFKNQVRRAAELFRIVMDGNSSYYPIGDNYVQYNPNAACGGSVVSIRNLATSALYRYTPYQPNAGALAAGYGTASCGAYGNRNFYLYFEDWFGGITDDGVVIPESSNVVEGRYTIVSALSDERVLDVNGNIGSINDYTNAQIGVNRDLEKQEWTIRKDGGSYVVVNSVSGKVLDVQNGESRAGANVQMFTSNGTCAQKWNIVKNSDNTYTLYSSCSGLALDVSGGSTAEGANVQLYFSNSTPAQKWKLIPKIELDDGEYQIVSKLSSNVAIDLAGGAGSAVNGANIHIFNKNNTYAQTWRLTHAEDGYYTITNTTNGKVFDVAGGGTNNGANVQVYLANGTCAQKWQIVKNSDESFSIYSACSGKALDVAGGSTNNGTNIHIYVANGTNAQKWQLVNTKTLQDGIYKIKSEVTKDFVVDLAKSAELAGPTTNVQMNTINGADTQSWKVQYDGNGYYEIVNPATSLAVDVAGGGTVGGSNIHSYIPNGTCAQRWQILKNTDGSYSLYSACSGRVMDVAGADTANGANVQIYDRNGTNAQSWKFEK